MSPQTQNARPISRADTAAMILFMIAGAVIAVGIVIAAARRVAEILSGQSITVPAVFDGTPADAPIGPDGAPVTVGLQNADLVAPALPGASVAALVIEQVVIVVTVLIVVGTLLWLTWNLVRGTVFSRTNTALVTTAGITGLVGFIAAPFFANMGANGTFARLSDGTFDNVVVSAELFPMLLIAFVAALASTVFTIGARLQRETEGLV
ncbi:hypothetical protein [Microbacterium sp. 18062]|uniref:hypothetical protein n=1 Tax=Microbacterium sp. 18062 TaxID=2681410 RepID=UPI00135CC230|nr:hypothetical protein [Microbacterium sp. 18062]